LEPSRRPSGRLRRIAMNRLSLAFFAAALLLAAIALTAFVVRA
jgi:hypothetical protein